MATGPAITRVRSSTRTPAAGAVGAAGSTGASGLPGCEASSSAHASGPEAARPAAPAAHSSGVRRAAGRIRRRRPLAPRAPTSQAWRPRPRGQRPSRLSPARTGARPRDGDSCRACAPTRRRRSAASATAAQTPRLESGPPTWRAARSESQGDMLGVQLDLRPVAPACLSELGCREQRGRHRRYGQLVDRQSSAQPGVTVVHPKPGEPAGLGSQSSPERCRQTALVHRAMIALAGVPAGAVPRFCGGVVTRWRWGSGRPAGR